MSNNDFDDLILNGKAEKQPGWDLKEAADHFDASLTRKKFPSITLGNAPRLELFDETVQVSEIKSRLAAEGCNRFPSDALPIYVEHMALEITQENLQHNKATVNECPTIVEPEAPLIGSFLDSPISYIPGLSKRLCNQLENCGFHTVGLMDNIRIVNAFPVFILK